jgi:hypothetical protein
MTALEKLEWIHVAIDEAMMALENERHCDPDLLVPYPLSTALEMVEDLREPYLMEDK